jgi:ribose transport system ATP-binding protein
MPDSHRADMVSVSPEGPVLAVRDLNKRFPGVHALRNVSFDIRPGEVHAVIGENGAGKSTLMRVLSGVYPPDSGTVLMDGAEVSLASPQDAFRRGIAMVWQDTRLVPTLDVAWNIALGHEAGGRLLVNRSAMVASARRALERIGSTADPFAPAGSLSRTQMQQVEIARALSRDARILILDEPTSALTPAETAGLFEVLSELKREGTAVVFISHRLPEVLSISDRITVMRDGEVTGTLATEEATEAQLVSMMVGRPMGLDYPAAKAPPGDVVLEVRNLSGRAIRDVSFDVRAGEIVGLGGIQGSGQQDCARALFGLGKTGGVVKVKGLEVAIGSPSEAIDASIVYVPADRRTEGLFPVHSIRENIGLPHLSRWVHGGLLRSAAERADVQAEFDRLKIKAPNSESLVATLSGGNQQKVVFARWFIGEADVYILDEPTQGVDVATKLEIYTLVRSLADAGAAVVVVSSDLPELIGLTDRILVFSDGQIMADLASREASEESVISHAVGSAQDASVATGDGQGSRARMASPLVHRYLPALMLLVLLAGITITASLMTPYFLTPRNFSSMAGQVAPLALASLGQMATILLGGIDLSIGPTISLVTSIASYVLSPDSTVPVSAGIALCLLAGLAVGAMNAVLVALLRIPDLVATLATFSIVQGVALIVRPSPGGRVDSVVAQAITDRVMMVPVVFAIAVIAYIAVEVLLLRGRIGAQFYAAGASSEAAEAAGIRTRRLRASAYLFSGLMAAIAGLIIAARIGSGDPQAGTTFTLATVTAVVVGGTSVFGGVGTAVGTFFGAVLIILMQNVLNQLQVSAYWQYIWTGVLTLAAVGFHGLRSQERRAAMRQSGVRLIKFSQGARIRR